MSNVTCSLEGSMHPRARIVLRNIRHRLRMLKIRFESDIRVTARGGPLTAVAFSGLFGYPDVPRFDLEPTFAGLDFNLIQVRDTRQIWYQQGIRPARNIDETCDVLAREIHALGVPAFTIGNSAGGYGALLFAARMDLAGALAFAPQTFLDRATREKWSEDRWPEETRRLDALSSIAPDLRAELSSSPVTVEVWYNQEHRLDALHAERLAGLPAVTLRSLSGDGHRPAAVLRGEGRLAGVIEDFAGRLI